MTNRIGDRHRTAPAGAEQAESVHAGGIGHSLEVGDPVLQGQARILPVGQAAAALVVPDEGVLLAQEFHPVAPDRRRPVPFEVGHPMSGLDHRRAVPARSVGEPHAIRRGAEPQFLAHVNMLRASRHARRRNLGSSTDAVGGVEFVSFRAWRWCARRSLATCAWIGDDRIQSGQILEADASGAAMPTGSTIIRMVLLAAHGKQPAPPLQACVAVGYPM